MVDGWGGGRNLSHYDNVQQSAEKCQGWEDSHSLSIAKHLRTQSVIGPYIDQCKASRPVNRGLKLAPPALWYWPWMQGSILRLNHNQGSHFLISSSPILISTSFECTTDSRWTSDHLVTKQCCFAGEIQSHGQSNVMVCKDIKILFFQPCVRLVVMDATPHPLQMVAPWVAAHNCRCVPRPETPSPTTPSYI